MTEQVTRPCKHAGDDVKHARRPAPYPGPRCATCHRRHRKETKQRRRGRTVERVYGITADELAALLAFQNGRCAVLRCQANGTSKALAVDHDHSTGAVRGAMCGPHNRWLGMAGDDPAVFESIAEYLRNPPYERMKRMSETPDPLDSYQPARKTAEIVLPDPLDYTEPGPVIDSPVQHDRWDRYKLPPPPGYPHDQTGDENGYLPWTRVSTVKGTVQNTHSIERWNFDMLAVGMSISPDLCALAASVPVGKPGAGKTMAEIREQAWTRAGKHAAANYGSAHHAFTEQIDAAQSEAEIGRIMDRVPEHLRKDIEAYRAELDRAGLTPAPEYIERVVLNTELGGDGSELSNHHAAAGAGTAGRIDRAYTKLDGSLCVGDLKTGKNAIEYGAGETAVQLAIYAHSEWILDESSMTWQPMPDVSQTIGYLIWLPVGRGICEAVPLDLRYGWEGALIAQEERRWQRDSAKRALLPSTLMGKVLSDNTLPSAEPAKPVEKPKGKRACSVCQQAGHRKGSDKCPGPEQPSGPNPDDMPWCDDTSHRSAGWSADARYGSVCGECGRPSQAVYEAKGAESAARQQIAESRERIDRENRDRHGVSMVNDKPAADLDDPFADLSDDELSWEAEIEQAPNVEALKDVGRRIVAAGAMTPELRVLALERRTVLTDG